MDHADQVWAELVTKYDLVDHRASELATWWHTDANLSREVETFADMSKSRSLGFLDYQDSARSFVDLFETLRAQRIIPPLGAFDISFLVVFILIEVLRNALCGAGI